MADELVGEGETRVSRGGGGRRSGGGGIAGSPFSEGDVVWVFVPAPEGDTSHDGHDTLSGVESRRPRTQQSRRPRSRSSRPATAASAALSLGRTATRATPQWSIPRSERFPYNKPRKSVRKGKKKKTSSPRDATHLVDDFGRKLSPAALEEMADTDFAPLCAPTPRGGTRRPPSGSFIRAKRFPKPMRDRWGSYRTTDSRVGGLGCQEHLSEFTTGPRGVFGRAPRTEKPHPRPKGETIYIPPGLGEPQPLSNFNDKPGLHFAKTPRADMTRLVPGPGPKYKPKDILGHTPHASMGRSARPSLKTGGVYGPGPVYAPRIISKSAPSFGFGTAGRFPGEKTIERPQDRRRRRKAHEESKM